MPWTVQTALSESSDWETQDDLSGNKDEQHAWTSFKSVLQPNAALEDSMGFGSSPEEFGELPENVTIAPEFIEFDGNSWNVFPDAD